MAGCTTTSPNYENQQTFDTAESAVEALATAAQRGDITALEAIFGSSGREVLTSGDPGVDKHQREVFVLAMNEGWTLERTDSNSRELIVGNEQWPFPIPLVKDSRGWWFDTIEGADEVLVRRIGRNELAVMDVCHAFVVAQHEYAAESRDGKPKGIYAQKVRSDPGKHNGLHWKRTSPDEQPSPLGELAAQASAEGYTASPQGQQATPFHGYYFRILTQQGAAAPGGARSYLVNGEMTQGFALLAYPAEYGSSGIMTFMVNHDGIVHEKDLGDETSSIAASMTDYNPDASWAPAN
jgi:hypothetical protein